MTGQGPFWSFVIRPDLSSAAARLSSYRIADVLVGDPPQSQSNASKSRILSFPRNIGLYASQNTFDDQWNGRVHRARSRSAIWEVVDEYYTISSRSLARECLSSLLCLFFSYLVNLAAGRFTVVLNYTPPTAIPLSDLPILIGPYRPSLRSPCYPRRRSSTCPSQTAISHRIADANPLDKDNLFPQHSVCA